MSSYSAGALCGKFEGGIPIHAEDRVLWLMRERGLARETAELQVMKEFPAAFVEPGSRRYDPKASCGKTEEGQPILAQDRVSWLVNNKQMGLKEAEQIVMNQFPESFLGLKQPDGSRYDPCAICGKDGSGAPTTAESRVQWLLRNKSMTRDQAEQTVMDQFPTSFSSLSSSSSGSRRYDPKASCGKTETGQPILAEDRASWLIHNKQMSRKEAEQTVMNQFPESFLGPIQPDGSRYDPRAICGKDGSGASTTAESRVQWLLQNKSMSLGFP